MLSTVYVYFNSCCISVCSYPVFLQTVSGVTINSNLNGSLACPGQLIRLVCNVNSPLLAWSSPQYIGPPGVRIEFTSDDDEGSVTPGLMETNAVLLGVNGTNVTSSELNVIAPFHTASITCEDAVPNNDTFLIQVPGMFCSISVLCHV